jgi:hypothetical protein
MFQHLLGIEFHFKNHIYVHRILPFGFTQCFVFVDILTYQLSHPSCKFALDAAIPGHTLAWIFEQVHACLIFVWVLNCEIFLPNKGAAPTACIQSFVNGAIVTWLPSQTYWVEAYGNDSVCFAIRNLVLNPGETCKAALSEVHYAYCQPLRQSHIVIEGKMLIIREPICGSKSYTRLQIVTEELCNILFVAFHSNPIEGI